MNETFLRLVRAGIGHASGDLPEAVDWRALSVLADRQGLTAVVWDAVAELMNQGALTGEREMPKDLKFDWFGNALYHEQRYESYKAAIGSLAEFYSSHWFRMMLLKGYGLSLDYPVPSHRPCGDIDVWLFGSYKEADAAIAGATGVKVDDSHHHHTVFKWKGYSVENHYDLVNVHAFRSNVGLEKVFKELAMDDRRSVEVDGAHVYLPSADFNALFLLRHAMLHFASTSINLRQVLDWGLFMEKHSAEIDWKWFGDMLERFFMLGFYDCLRRICVEDLGLSPDTFKIDGHIDSSTKARVLNDILSPEFQGREPEGLVRRVWFKFRRRCANTWKHRLCYREDLLSSFFVSAWAHVLKPKTI